MGKSRRRPRGDGDENDQERGSRAEPESDAGEGEPTEIVAPGTTGRYLVLLRQDAVQAGVQALTAATGRAAASASDFDDSAIDAETLTGPQIIVFDKLAVAVVDSPPEQLQGLSAMADGDGPILAIEPEQVVYAITRDRAETAVSVLPPVAPMPVALDGGGGRLPVDYLLGYRDAVNHVVDKMLATSGTATAVAAGPAPALDETVLTWGLQVTNVATSRFTGAGVRLAVLDTGFDLGHPDFVGRRIVSQSFVLGQAVQDGHGHGTHCIGTACGPRQPGQPPRYGIASDAEIYVGKVLSNQGSGTDGGILAGIEWAITNRCAIISMSLGAATFPGQGFSRVYEAVARRAHAAGTLIIAAAGNESNRPMVINPVAHPANCPSILAVAALDDQVNVTFFSNGGLNPQGGQVDIAGPGLRVRSSWPRPLLYRTISGTSMATPHVAGIAALHVEANPDMRGGVLGWLLLQSARRLALTARDVGAGLVQAP